MRSDVLDPELPLVKSALVLRIPLAPTARFSETARSECNPEPIDWSVHLHGVAAFDSAHPSAPPSSKRRKGSMDLEGLGR